MIPSVAVVAGGSARGIAANGQDPRSRLERGAPDIAKAITLLWGYPELNSYFTKLWTGETQGPIDPEVMAEIMLLARIHNELMPTRPATNSTIYGTAYGSRFTRPDVWGDVPRRR